MFGAVPLCKTSGRSCNISPWALKPARADLSVDRTRCFHTSVESVMAAVGFPTGVALSGTRGWQRGSDRVNADAERGGGRHGKESVEYTQWDRGKIYFLNTITEGDVVLPCSCGTQSHHYVAVSFGNSCISLFQRYFFLIYLIPQEKSISGPWHRLPLLTLTADRLSLHTHTHTHVRTQAHSHTRSPAVWRKTGATDRNNSSPQPAAAGG